MKKGAGICLVLFLVAFLSIGLVSANWFSDIFGKITGHVVSSPTINSVVVTSSLNGGWQLKAVGDLNSDGVKDLFYQDAQGKVVAWIMDANGTMKSAVLLQNSTSGWQLKAVGTMAGSTDLFFQDAGGNIAYWIMSPSGIFVSANNLPSAAGWQLKAVGTMAGSTDLFFQDAGGNIAYWIMSPSGIFVSSNILQSAGGWLLKGAGIMNGATNLFFQDSSGNIAYWIMSPSGTFVSSNTLQSSPGWSLRAVAGNNLYFQSTSGTSIAYWTLTFSDSPQTCTSFTYTLGTCSVSCGGGTQTMTVATQSPSGCTGGTPQTSQTCNTQACATTSTTCSSFIYSDWSACVSKIQTRTITTQLPSGCSGGTSESLTQPCEELFPCSEFNWNYQDGACEQNNTLVRIWSKMGNCDSVTGTNKPGSQVVACNSSSISCMSFSYTNWSECLPSGIQTREVSSSTPENCMGGDVITSQLCNYTDFSLGFPDTTQGVTNPDVYIAPDMSAGGSGSDSLNPPSDNSASSQKQGWVKTFFVKVVCKLSSPLNLTEYSSCTTQYGISP